MPHLDTAGSNQLQPAKLVAPLGKKYLRKGKMPHGNVRSEEEVREAALQTPRPQTDNKPHSPAPCTAQGGEVDRGVRNEGVKLSLEKDREGAGVISIFVFVSRYPNLF